jgi:hypothetical protein
MEGVTAELPGPCSVATFLREHLELTDEEMAQGARTVLIDGRPIDDFGTLLCAGCRLALSGALPGLAGAALRSGGPLASLRGTISAPTPTGGDGAEPVLCHSPAPPEAAARARPTLITVCLFNTAQSAIGPALLRRGVVLEPARLSQGATAGMVRLRLSSAGDLEIEELPPPCASR